MWAARVKIVKRVLKSSMAIMSQPQKDRTHTSFPEKVKWHKVQHGVLDVVNLFFQWELRREKCHYDIKYVHLLVFSQITQCRVTITVTLQNGRSCQDGIHHFFYPAESLFLAVFVTDTWAKPHSTSSDFPHQPLWLWMWSACWHSHAYIDPTAQEPWCKIKP